MRKKVLDDQVGALRAVLRSRLSPLSNFPTVHNSGGHKWNFLSVCAPCLVRQSLRACHLPRPGSCSVLFSPFSRRVVVVFHFAGLGARWRTRAVSWNCEGRYSKRCAARSRCLSVPRGLVHILEGHSRVNGIEKRRPRLPRDMFEPLCLRTRFVAAT